MLLREAEIAHAFGNHPAIGGTDGPEVHAARSQCGHQIGHLRIDARLYKFFHVLCRRGAQFLVAQTGIDLNHLAADLLFADLAGTVGPVAGVDPVAGETGDQPLFKRPNHEPITGVAAPKGSVAIEDGDLWSAPENQPLELLGGPLASV